MIGEINELGFWFFKKKAAFQFMGFRDLGISRCHSAPGSLVSKREIFYKWQAMLSDDFALCRHGRGSLLRSGTFARLDGTPMKVEGEKENRKMKNEKNESFCFLWFNTWLCNFKKKNYFMLCCFRLRKQKKKRLSNEVLRKKHTVLSHVKKKRKYKEIKKKDMTDLDAIMIGWGNDDIV